MTDDRIGKVLERVAQEIVFCNCATEGPALKRCEHVSLAAALEERLGPLLRAGQAMRNELSGASYAEKSAWDAALNELTGLAALEGRE